MENTNVLVTRELIDAGSSLATLAFNLSQSRALEISTREILKSQQERWDEAVRNTRTTITDKEVVSVLAKDILPTLRRLNASVSEDSAGALVHRILSHLSKGG